ncbi:MAG: hypothetical protein ABIE07_11285 [Candidatus Zixiibacteriota bacterium]
MKYAEFRALIERELKRNPSGLTWMELRKRLKLPYNRPCPTWIGQLEFDISLKRKKGFGCAVIWML